MFSMWILLLICAADFTTTKWSAFAALSQQGYYDQATDLLHRRTERSLYKNAKKWPGGIVPYTIGENVTHVQRNVIQLAIVQYEAHTCIKFVPRTNEENYLTFARTTGPDCASYIGMAYPGQEINMSYCPLSTVMHEMMHAIGFVHEHQRIDRNDYLKIQFEKLEKESDPPYPPQELDSEIGKLPFDYRSLMHYASRTEENGQVVMIEPLYKGSYPNVEDLLGNEEGFSTCDVVKINIAYQCDDRCYDNSAEKCQMGKVFKLPFVSCPIDSESYCTDISFANDTRCSYEPGKYLLGCSCSCDNCAGNCYDTRDGKKNYICKEIKARMLENPEIQCSKEEENLCPMTCGIC